MSADTIYLKNYTPQDFTSLKQSDFYNYWNKIRAERILPARADINPVDILKILPYMIIFDKTDNDYDIRLMGTKCATIFGEQTGVNLLSIPDGMEAKERFDLCAHNKSSYFLKKPLAIYNKDYLESSLLVMPLSDDAENVNMIVAIFDFY